MKLINLVVTMILIVFIGVIGGCSLAIGLAGCAAKKINEKGLKNVATQIWEGTNTVKK